MWGKSLAALLLGLPAALALVGLVALAGPGEPGTRTLPVLLMFFPAWVAVISATFLFKTGLQAWVWMSLLTALGFALIHLLKALGLAGLPL